MRVHNNLSCAWRLQVSTVCIGYNQKRLPVSYNQTTTGELGV